MFALWVRQANGTAYLLINQVGSYRGEVAFSVENPNNVVLEVTGIGEWELRLEWLM